MKFLCFLAVLAVGISTAQAQDPVKHGRALVSEFCSECHAIGKRGRSRHPSAPPFRTLGLALLAGWCATSLFSSHFQTFNEGHLIALLLGVFLAVPAAQARPSVPKAVPRTDS